jgi:ribosomal protein L24E
MIFRCESRYTTPDVQVYYSCSLLDNHMFEHEYTPLGIKWTTEEEINYERTRLGERGRRCPA